MLACLLVGSVFAVGSGFHVDPDLWWHVKVGEQILRSHRWPTTDIYSFTVSGQPWVAYEWLGDVLFATMNRLAGLQGLLSLLILIGSAVVLALYAFATIVTRNSKAGFAAASVLFVLATASFSMRPQMLGYLFLILTLVALERFREGKHRTLWLLPVLMLVWVNTHGTWIIGMGTIFVYWVSGLMKFQIGELEAKAWTQRERHSIACVFLLCLLALPITPYGTRIAASPFEFAFSLPLNVKYINEWQSMPFDIPGGKLFLSLVLGMILIQVVCRLKWRMEQLALFLFGTLMAFLHVRFLLIFVPFFAPVLGGIFAKWMPRYDDSRDKFALNAVLMACVAAGIIHYFPSRAHLEQKVSDQYPVEAIAYLQRHAVPGPMYNNYGFGGYLVWSRGPEQKVFIDGRGDVYERGGVLADYLHISRLQPGALEVLRGHGINSCLLERDEPLATVLYASPEWKRVYFDHVSALFVRVKPTASAGLLMSPKLGPTMLVESTLTQQR
jgi:hypothetical protein